MNTNAHAPIELELRKLDLTDKEIRVYLICLEMNRSSIQNIAKLSELSRPTAYRIIDSLEEKGLVSRYGTKRKNLVLAESPDEILGILRIKKKRLEEQEREFLRVISTLKNKYYSDEQNEIKVFSDQEGVDSLLDTLSSTPTKKICVMFCSSNNSKNANLDNVYRSIRRRLGEIEIRELHEKKFKESKHPFIKQRMITVPTGRSGIMILSDKFFCLEKNHGIMIENKETVQIIQSFFDLLWKMSA